MGLLIASYASTQLASAQSDFNAYAGSTIEDSQIDGAIGAEWDDAAKYTGIAIDPQGTAEVWTKNDGTNLYIAVKFTADAGNPWVGIQLGGNSCMEANTDTALFGNDHYNVDGYVDCYMSPTGGAKADATKNGMGAISVDSSNVVTVELKKPLYSGDTDGRDINWAANETHTMIIIWDSNGLGSSGGMASHAGGTVLGTGTVRTILVNSSEKPGSAANGGTAFPSSTYIVALVVVAAVAIVILAAILKRRK